MVGEKKIWKLFRVIARTAFFGVHVHIWVAVITHKQVSLRATRFVRDSWTFWAHLVFGFGHWTVADTALLSFIVRIILSGWWCWSFGFFWTANCLLDVAGASFRTHVDVAAVRTFSPSRTAANTFSIAFRSIFFFLSFIWSPHCAKIAWKSIFCKIATTLKWLELGHAKWLELGQVHFFRIMSHNFFIFKDI